MGNRRYIIAGRLIDGVSSEVQKRMALVEENGRIIDVINAASVPADYPDAIVDMSHCTIMPPLFDCSVDLASSASLADIRDIEKSQKDITTDIGRHIHFCHTHGVLGLADCRQHITAVDQADKTQSADEAVTIKAAGRVYSTSEHKSLKSDFIDFDFVKIVHKGSIGVIKSESIDQENKEKENLLRLVQEAHDSGKQTIVLANGTKAVREALDSGCDAIEQGYGMGEENLEIMGSRRILWIPCLVRAKIFMEMATTSQKTEASQQLKTQQNLLRKAKSLNVPVAVGTGAGSPGIIHGEAVIEEIQQFIKSGYSLVEALRAASLVGAEFFKIPEIGNLQVGGRANFIVSRGMVQQLPRKLFYLENIYWLGKPSQGYQKNPVKTITKT